MGEEVEPELDAGEEFAGEVFDTSEEGGWQVGVVGYGIDVVVVGEQECTLVVVVLRDDCDAVDAHGFGVLD